MNKRLSLLLSLLLVMSLVFGLSCGICAAGDSRVGAVEFNYADELAVGDGWVWVNDGINVPTLTLSGIDVDSDRTFGSAVHIRGAVRLVLQGQNRIVSQNTGALYFLGDQAESSVIEGSGTLEVKGNGAEYYGIGIFDGDLTIKSGYITAYGQNYGLSAGGAVEVQGGSLSVSGGTTGMEVNTFSISGGYVKIASTRLYGLKTGQIDVSGGYLESSASTSPGIRITGTDNSTVSGGVVKATGQDYGIEGSGAYQLRCTGGVVIASATPSTGTAIAGSVSGGNGEQYWPTLTPSGTGTALNSTAGQIAGNNVVIAKVAYNTTETLTADKTYDSAYFNVAAGKAVESSMNVTFTGGNYAELKSNNDTVNANSCTINDTLAVLNESSNYYYSNARRDINCTTLNVKEGGSLLVTDKNDSYANGISCDTLNNEGNTVVHIDYEYAVYIKNSLTNSGNFIAASTGANAIVLKNNAVLNSTGVITALGERFAIMLDDGASSVGELTVVNTEPTDDIALFCQKDVLATGYEAVGSTANYGELMKAGFSADSDTYTVGAARAKVVCFRAGKSATVSDNTVSGEVGKALTAITFTVTLTNDTFLSALPTVVTDWVTSLPAGLEATCARTGVRTATITISGTPTAVKSGALAITIPLEYLFSEKDLTVTVNPNAKYDIKKGKVAVPAAVTGLVYNGEEQIGVATPAAGAKYTISGDTAKTDAGSYTATATLKDTSNYAWDIQTPVSTAQSIAWSIAPKEIDTVTAENKAILTGDTLPTFTATCIDVNGKEVKFPGTLQYTCAADGETAGTYDIVPHDGTVTDTNYSVNGVTYKKGTLTVKDFFTDVTREKYFFPAVRWAFLNNIVSGTGDKIFSPYDICCRADAMVMLWRAAGSPAPTAKENPFTDVKASAYYYKAVLWAVENKITYGTTANTFSPEAEIDRAQAVTFLWRLAGKPEATKAIPFSDVPAKAYYTKAVQWACEEGVTQGTSTTTFSPKQDCLRCQFVTLLYSAEK